MQQNISFFDLNGRQLEKIQNKYALLEPLVDTYLSESEEREYSKQVCTKLGISERTLRRYLQRFREGGIYTLTRKKRSDAGVLRVFSDEILKKALQLLEQSSSRSVVDTTYCSEECRSTSKRKAHQEAQKRYRKTKKGKEAHSEDENSRRMGLSKKIKKSWMIRVQHYTAVIVK